MVELVTSGPSYGVQNSHFSPQPYDILGAMDTVPSMGLLRSNTLPCGGINDSYGKLSNVSYPPKVVNKSLFLRNPSGFVRSMRI
jgi:hypothetical protein